MIVNVYRWLFGKRVTVVPPEWAPTGDPYSVPCLTPFEKNKALQIFYKCPFYFLRSLLQSKNKYRLSV